MPCTRRSGVVSNEMDSRPPDRVIRGDYEVRGLQVAGATVFLDLRFSHG